MPTKVTIAELADRAARKYLTAADDAHPQDWWIDQINECHRDLWVQARAGRRWDASTGSSPKITFDAATGQITLAEDVFDLSLVKVDDCTIDGSEPGGLEDRLGTGDWQATVDNPAYWYRLDPFTLQLAPIGGTEVKALVYYCPADVLDGDDTPRLVSPLHFGLVYGACYFAALNDHERDTDGQLKAHYAKLYQPYVLMARKFAESLGDTPSVMRQVR